MLNEIAKQRNLMARANVINHPNAWNCQVLRKVVNRPGASVGGSPVVGGMMRLDSEDEEDYQFEALGNGFALEVGDPFQPADMVDRRDANNGTNERRFLIEPEHAPGTPGWFDIKKRDVVYLLLDDGNGDFVRLAFEVVGPETTANIPPYGIRYIMNRRDDLHL